MNFPETQSLLLFEEIKPQRVDVLSIHDSLRENQLGNGDIIVFQKEPSELYQIHLNLETYLV